MLRAGVVARIGRRLSQAKINTFAIRTVSRPTCLASKLFRGSITRSCPKRLSSNNASPIVDQLTYDQVCNETLESLCDYFEEILDNASHLKKADVTYGDGVLTVKFGPPYGTYVINRQSPNKQIWLSSPKSGPKRYDLVLENGGYWIYKHDGISLHKLLQNEISSIVRTDIDFGKCAHSLV